MIIQAEGQTYHTDGPQSGNWERDSVEYRYNGKSRKAAINWAIKKIEQEFPGHKEYMAEIVDCPE